jgi:predicted ATPase/class 3 adenylate cyclase
MRALPSGTVTLLFTDIEGSTRLAQELGEERFNAALSEHRRVLREAFQANGGIELRTEGDSFFAAFASARKAVAAAAQAQCELTSGPLRVRIGLHTGEPLRVEHEDGYVGVDVHCAARICASGHGGQVLLSQATRNILDDDVELRDLGEHRLKDFSEPVEIYQLGRQRFPPLKTLNNTNLPRPTSDLIGRKIELAELGALLLREDVRLVTLTGPGGIGKTRLSVSLGLDLLDEFPSGVFFVELASVADPALVAPTIARVLGVRESAEHQLVTSIQAHLADKRALLVVDNLEHLMPAAPLLADLLAGSPRLAILATSRGRLRLSGEQEYPLAPPPEEDAVDLFVERARAAKPTFALDGDRDAVVAICRRLDKLPLALELAAARVKVLTPPELLERLDRRLSLLTGGGRERPKRQQTLRATIEWSYRLLDEEEQRLFVSFAVFAGGTTLGTIEAVCGADIDTLHSLVDESLIHQGDDHSKRRFWMLETIREYALELFEASGEAEQLRRRHAFHFLALVEPLAAHGAYLDAVDTDNVRSALSWSLERSEVELALRLAIALEYFWDAHGRFSEGERWANAALAQADGQPPALRARAFSVVGMLSCRRGDYDAASQALEAGLLLARQVGDEEAIAELLNNFGVVAGLSEPERAAPYFREALVLLRRLGATSDLPVTLGNLGRALLEEGNLEGAEAVLSEGLSRAREHNQSFAVAFTLNVLGRIQFQRGDPNRARSFLESSLKSLADTPHTWQISESLEDLAAVLATQGDATRAARLWGAAEALREEIGAPVAPAERLRYEEAVASAREAYPDAAFESAWAEGRAMTPEAAIDHAVVSVEA